ncbi:MAG: hypothetical protein HC876_19900, partial [Chloroflexaceae bacterium]|nr:hypothetical protein [Chloroflexaceae bacterium]
HLDILALHEKNKLQRPHTVLLGGSLHGLRSTRGRRYAWKHTGQQLITACALTQHQPHARAHLQKATQLPWIVRHAPTQYLLNTYEITTSTVPHTVHTDLTYTLPDTLDLYIDSSGSMHSNLDASPGLTRFDLVCKLIYGIIGALRHASARTGKAPELRLHNFADRQVSSPPFTPEHFWTGHLPLLTTLYAPNNGQATENLDIHMHNDTRTRAYLIITDGDLVIPGRTEREANKMRSLAQRRNNRVMLFEIGGTYSLGKAMANERNITYHTAHATEIALKTGLEVLLHT